MEHDLEKAYAYLRDFSDLESSLENELRTNQFIKIRSFSRKHRFTSMGSPAQYIAFLEKGYALAYRKRADTRVVSWFRSAPSGIIPENFFTGNACQEEIVLNAGSSIVYTCRQGIGDLFRKHPKTAEFIRLIQEKHLHENEEEKMLLRGLSAREKYIHLATTRPEIIENFSGKDIGSYLGIRPRQLYNIRKAYGKEKFRQY
ncbi:CRP-like cAMP-binding protein [Anseongella ginsenosidimutans]|uniref:CRP-like cAMP-binding protein n=1 Tax=Anseongella ginsenosidimutans TaxID=496056 RepID=A0A4R3KKJ8_9SPHI|nr:Crp/Fnr family transcriptional regulator [Anseongella ginsenosidimutans]QEC51497.1 Crp/Fnr family transcriptional regulator [Anseongella ginsenosidimutans]TCS84324.1 CRP-like cAMP-binding protein [Anseongella ginsenosidimutans]